jgi:hypothetical protein
VFITDRGAPAPVLLTIEEYQRLSGEAESIIDMLAMPGVEDVDFEAPRVGEFCFSGQSLAVGDHGSGA